MQFPPKVFVIGLNKSATRSIHVLFVRSGYGSLHHKGGELARDIFACKGRGEKPLTQFVGISVFADMEAITGPDAPLFGYSQFAYLHHHYPDARFIFNSRPLEDWLQSRMNHRNGSYFRKYCKLLGTEDEVEVRKVWTKHYEDHHEAVEDYFADRPGQLLRFQVGVDGAEKIAEFVAPEMELDTTQWVNETKRLKAGEARAPVSPAAEQRMKALRRYIRREKRKIAHA